ncbi:MAG: hypothetical protein ABW321_24985 [Polyangiales bacterium]
MSTLLSGAADTCDATCETQEITQCAADDGCCPESCTLANDNDCSPSCGDGVISGNEKCEAGSDKPCPTADECNDQNACTKDEVVGSATQCSAECSHQALSTNSQSDGCCPSGGNANVDPDCSPTCGNRVKETGEACDGDCPTTCARATGCAREELSGTARECNARCVPGEITSRVDGDGCCPDGANAGNDGDCDDECGDGVKTGAETCDRSSRTDPCPGSCDDGDPCTDDRTTGNANECNVACSNPRITQPIAGDGCCLPGTTGDSDCGATCGNGMVEREGGEECDYAASGSNTWECNSETCKNTGLNAETTFTKRCVQDFDCATNEVCAMSLALGAYFGVVEKICVPPCSAEHTCGLPPGYRVAGGPDGNRCNGQSECIVDCATSSDCPPGLTCELNICH